MRLVIGSFFMIHDPRQNCAGVMKHIQRALIRPIVSCLGPIRQGQGLMATDKMFIGPILQGHYYCKAVEKMFRTDTWVTGQGDEGAEKTFRTNKLRTWLRGCREHV